MKLVPCQNWYSILAHTRTGQLCLRKSVMLQLAFYSVYLRFFTKQLLARIKCHWDLRLKWNIVKLLPHLLQRNTFIRKIKESKFPKGGSVLPTISPSLRSKESGNVTSTWAWGNRVCVCVCEPAMVHIIPYTIRLNSVVYYYCSISQRWYFTLNPRPPILTWHYAYSQTHKHTHTNQQRAQAFCLQTNLSYLVNPSNLSRYNYLVLASKITLSRLAVFRSSGLAPTFVSVDKPISTPPMDLDLDQASVNPGPDHLDMAHPSQNWDNLAMPIGDWSRKSPTKEFLSLMLLAS